MHSMKTVHERAEEQRQAKLAQMRQQIEAGTLVVRKMTAEERAKYPAKPQPEKSKKRAR
jgi:anti-sigma28 factor (negative regulator of flagellin synthesis)